MSTNVKKLDIKSRLRPYYRSVKRTTLYQKAFLAKRYCTSYYLALRDIDLFENLDTYFMFIGHGCSGHSLVAGLLDAHPNIICPDEVDTLKYIKSRFTANQIYHVLLKESQLQAMAGLKKAGRRGKPYSRAVPGQWQGRFDVLKAIGDAKAGVSTKRLAADPGLLSRLRQRINLNIRIIQIVSSNSRSGCKLMKSKEEAKKIIAKVNSVVPTVIAKSDRCNRCFALSAVIALITTQFHDF